MEQLDNTKVPRLSSPVGRKYHSTQLIVQLPQHDMSTDSVRHLKTDAQRESFDEFVRVRNTDALDIAKVVPTTDSPTVSI